MRRCGGLIQTRVASTCGVESVMRELLVRDSSNQSTIVKDSPPKYEDLETVPCDEPPQYDERTMNTPANNCDTNRPVQNLV